MKNKKKLNKIYDNQVLVEVTHYEKEKMIKLNNKQKNNIRIYLKILSR